MHRDSSGCQHASKEKEITLFVLNIGILQLFLTKAGFYGIIADADGAVACHVAARYWCEESPGIIGQDNG